MYGQFNIPLIKSYILELVRQKFGMCFLHLYVQIDYRCE